ncbi:MAG TPA: hypothetical protein VFB37_01570 [Steroidobacteraceae bacterium]|nr:hypothetical protein [Steroidobacteraceae bacterium]
MSQKPTPLTDAVVCRDEKGNIVITGKVNGREVVHTVTPRPKSVQRQLSLYKKLFADLG